MLVLAGVVGGLGLDKEVGCASVVYVATASAVVSECTRACVFGMAQTEAQLVVLVPYQILSMALLLFGHLTVMTDAL